MKYTAKSGAEPYQVGMKDRNKNKLEKTSENCKVLHKSKKETAIKKEHMQSLYHS